jgi:hypothetical protein
MKQLGISPKLIATIVTAIVGWVVTHYGANLDPDLAAAISAALGAAAGAITPPGNVVPK